MLGGFKGVMESFIPAQYARVCDGVVFGIGNLEYPKPAVHPL
jgi:hypothetical protein